MMKKCVLILVFVLCFGPNSFAQISSTGFDGTGTASTTSATLPAHPCTSVVVQNDPSNGSVNLKVGYTASPALVVMPGGSVTFKIYNSSYVYVKAVSGTPIYNWACGN